MAMVGHDDPTVMDALKHFCVQHQVNVLGVSLQFMEVDRVLALAAQTEGRPPAEQYAATEAAVFVQIAGVPPQHDDALDGVGDQLEQIFEGRVSTIQMVEKLDMTTGERQEKAQNGKLRFHVVKDPAEFRCITRFKLDVSARARLCVPARLTVLGSPRS